MKPKPQALPGMTDLISEIVSKNRRGRPAKYTAEVYQAVAALKLPGKSPRSQQNYFYRAIAYAALMEDQKRFAHALKRATILSELGRFQDADKIREFAGRICEVKWNSRRAIARLRHWRRRRRLDAYDLSRAFTRAINHFSERQPYITKAMVREAMRLCEESLESKSCTIPPG